MNTLFVVAMLFGMFAAGIGLWAFGQQLHGRGYGDWLDKIDATLLEDQRNVGRFLGPLGGGFVGAVRSINRVPFLGNRCSREMWEDLEELERQYREDRSQPPKKDPPSACQGESPWPIISVKDYQTDEQDYTIQTQERGEGGHCKDIQPCTQHPLSQCSPGAE